MNKRDAISLINLKYRNTTLNNRNTHWSNLVNYGNDFGWWLNIPFHKFKEELFLLLNDQQSKKFLFLRIPANSILYSENKFRNKEGTADIFISVNDKKTLTDSQSNSTSFQFAKYIVEEYFWK